MIGKEAKTTPPPTRYDLTATGTAVRLGGVTVTVAGHRASDSQAPSHWQPEPDSEPEAQAGTVTTDSARSLSLSLRVTPATQVPPSHCQCSSRNLNVDFTTPSRFAESVLLLLVLLVV